MTKKIPIKNPALLLSTIALSCSILFVGCGKSAPSDVPSEITSLLETEETTFDIAEYRNMISQCNDSIMKESVFLSNMGNFEYNYWKALNSVSGNIDYDSMVLKAYEWLAENSDSSYLALEKNYVEIGVQYKEIIEKSVSGTEVEELKDALHDLYEAFNSLYMLTTSPSGSISDFTDKFNNYTDAIKNQNSYISSLLLENHLPSNSSEN